MQERARTITWPAKPEIAQAAGWEGREVRADGRFQLDMHGEITIDDGEKIAYLADGIFVPPEDDTGIAQARYSVRLTTASSKYSWVNKLQIWAHGSVDVNKGEINVKAYTV